MSNLITSRTLSDPLYERRIAKLCHEELFINY